MGCCQVKQLTEPDKNDNVIKIRSDDPRTPLLANDHIDKGASSTAVAIPRRSSDMSDTSDSSSRRRIALSDDPSSPNRVSVVKAGSLGPVGVQRSTSVPTVTSGAKTVPLLEQITAKLKKPLNDLPAATDLPRMVARISITDYDGELTFAPMEARGSVEPRPTSIDLLGEMFDALQGAIDKPDEPKAIGDKLRKTFPSDFEGELRTALKPFLAENFPESSRISAIIKCINQGIVAPAVMSMRLQLAGKLNYKDCRGEWNIAIQFQKGDGVHVSHIKREQSFPDGFEFVWRLELIFAENMVDLVAVELSVQTIEFTTMKDPAEQQKIRTIFTDSGFLAATPSSPSKTKDSPRAVV